MKKTLPVSTLALTLALALMLTVGGGLALAQNGKAGQDNIYPQATQQAPAMSPEDRAAMEAMWKAHHGKMAPLRDQMWGKKMEYEALVANPNTKPGDVRPLIDEMIQLRVQMRAERENFFGQMKDKGFGPEFRRGMAREFRHGKGLGHGPAMGPGMMGGPGLSPCGMMGDRDFGYGYGHGRHFRDFDDFE